MYGDPHYTTFDGKRFLFEGRCNYVIAQDKCNKNSGSFSIQAENVACGSAGKCMLKQSYSEKPKLNSSLKTMQKFELHQFEPLHLML